jgi:hypothetical protein
MQVLMDVAGDWWLVGTWGYCCAWLTSSYFPPSIIIIYTPAHVISPLDH